MENFHHHGQEPLDLAFKISPELRRFSIIDRKVTIFLADTLNITHAIKAVFLTQVAQFSNMYYS
jgi:hypothetical protein